MSEDEVAKNLERYRKMVVPLVFGIGCLTLIWAIFQLFVGVAYWFTQDGFRITHRAVNPLVFYIIVGTEAACAVYLMYNPRRRK